MKKLIATIGAVVMGFGLFAGNYSTSFEFIDAGCEDGQTFDLSKASGWSTTAEDPFAEDSFALKVQDKSALPYPAVGTKVRRDELFPAGELNEKFLRLEIPSNTLERTIGDGQIYIDQLIRFTEYNGDPELVEDSKLAVWMKGDDSGKVGLYASVGTGSEVVNVQIAGDYESSRWYRLTIKTLGNVRETGTQAGFLIYIDGELASIVDDNRNYLNEEVVDDLTIDGGGYYFRGCLFASMDTGSAAIASVGYTGYGWVDDLIISEEAPKFAEDPYTFTVTPPEGLKVESVEANGEPLGELYIVPPGTKVRITYVAAEGYKITSDKAYDEVEINEDGQVIDKTGVEFGEIVAELYNDSILINEYVKAELYDLITNLGDGDQVSFVKGATITNPEDEYEILYEFSPDMTIDVAVGDVLTTWEIRSENYGDWIADNVGVAADFIKNFSFSVLEGSVALGADVDGELSVKWDEEPLEGSALYVENDITVSGRITSAYIVNDMTITLSGEGKVITQTEELNDVYTDDGSDPEILENTPEEGWYTYQIKASTGGFTVTVYLGEDITAIATNKTQGGEAKVFSETGNFKVDDGDVIAVAYACSVSGYRPTVANVEETIKADTDLTLVSKELLDYAITYNGYGEWAAGFEPVVSYTVETDTFDLPVAENIKARAGGVFQNWTNELGEVVTKVKQGSTGDLVLYAVWKQTGTDPVGEILADKVDGYDDLPSEQQKAAYDNASLLYDVLGGQSAAWIETVYGAGGKIPALKLAETTGELVAISVKYNLPIMTERVEAKAVASTADGFTFKLVDEGEDVNVAKAKVTQMIEWSADLGRFEVNTDEVAATVDDDGVTIKATFAKPNDETKGFMQLHLTPPEK